MAVINNENSSKKLLSSYTNCINLNYLTKQEIEELPDAPTEPITQHVIGTSDRPVKNFRFMPSNQNIENCLPVPGALLPSSSIIKSNKRKASRRRVYSKPRKRKKKELFDENVLDFSFSNETDSQDFCSDDSSDTIIMEDFDIPPVQNDLSTNLINIAASSSVKPPELGKLLISNDMIKSDFPVKVKKEFLDSNLALNSSKICSTNLVNIKKEPVDFDLTIDEQPALPEIRDVFPVQKTYVPNFRKINTDAKKFPDFCFKEASSINVPKPKQTARKRTAPRNQIPINNSIQNNLSLNSKNSLFNESLNSDFQNQQNILIEKMTPIMNEKSEIRDKKIVHSKNKADTSLNKQTKSVEFSKGDKSTVFPNLLRGLLEQEKLTKSSQKKKPVAKKKASPKKANSKIVKQLNDSFQNMHNDDFLARENDDLPHLFPFEKKLLSNRKKVKRAKNAKFLKESTLKNLLEETSIVENSEDHLSEIFPQSAKPLAKKKTPKKSKKTKHLEEFVFQKVPENVFSVRSNEDQFFSENSPLTERKTYKISKNKKLSEELRNALDEEFIVTDNENQPACSSEEKLCPEIKNNKCENLLAEEFKNTYKQNFSEGTTEDLMSFSNSVNTSPPKKKTPKRKAPPSKKKNLQIVEKKMCDKPRNAKGKYVKTNIANQPTFPEEKSFLESKNNEKLENAISEEFKNIIDDSCINSTEDLMDLSLSVNTLLRNKKTTRKKSLTKKKNAPKSKKKLSVLENTFNEDLIESKNEPACFKEQPILDVKSNELKNVSPEEFQNASDEELSVGTAEDLVFLSPSINICPPKKKKPKRSPRKRFYKKKRKSYKKSDLFDNSEQLITNINNTEAVASVVTKEQSIDISELNLNAFVTESLLEDELSGLNVRKKVCKRRSPKKNSCAKKCKSKSSKRETSNKNIENNVVNTEYGFKFKNASINFIQNSSANTPPALVSQSLLMKLNDKDIPSNSKDHDLPNNNSSIFSLNNRISLFNSSSKSILNLQIKKEPEEVVNETLHLDNNLRESSSNHVNAEIGAEKNTASARAMTKEGILDDKFKKQNSNFSVLQCDGISKPYDNISIKTEILSDDECSIIEVRNASSEANVCSMPTERFIEPFDMSLSLTENSLNLTDNSTQLAENSTKPTKSRKDPILSRLEDIAPDELLLGTRSETKRLRLLAATSNSEVSSSRLDSNNLQTDNSKQTSSNVSNTTSTSESSPYVTRKSLSKIIATPPASCSNEAYLQKSVEPKQISSTTSCPILISDATSSLNSIDSKQISPATSSPVPISKASLSHNSIQSKSTPLIDACPNSMPDTASSQVSIESSSEISDKFALISSAIIKTEIDSDEEDIPLSTLVSLKRKEPIGHKMEGTVEITLGNSSKNLNVFSSSTPIASEFPEIQKPIDNSNKRLDTLTHVMTSAIETELCNNTIPKSYMEIDVSKMSNSSQNFSDIGTPECSVAQKKPNLTQKLPNKECEKNDFLIPVTHIKKEKNIWPEEVEVPNDSLNKRISSNLLINDIHCSQNSDRFSMAALRSSEKNVNNFPLNQIVSHSTGTIQPHEILMNSDYLSFRDCLKEKISLNEKTDSRQSLMRPENSACESEHSLHLLNKQPMNLNVNENYSPITVNEINNFENRNFTSSSNRDSLISKFLSHMPPNIGTVSEKNLNSDNLIDPSFSFSNDLCSKSEDLDSSFSPRFSTPFNQDVSSRAVDSASPWIGNENSSDSMQTHSSNYSFSYQNYDFSSTENLSNYEKNMKFFFKFPFPGDILSGFYKCRQKLKGKNYLRANPLPWNLSYEEIATKLQNATCNGADQVKDDSDINDLQYYSLIDEEIGCYHRLLGVAPSKKLISKCKFDPLSENEMQTKSSLLSKSNIDNCDISVVPSIFITDFNEGQKFKQKESITELMNNTRRNVESLLPSETRHSLAPIEGSSKSNELMLSTADKSSPFVFSDSSNSQSISTSCSTKLNNVEYNFSNNNNMSDNSSSYQNISCLPLNTLNLVNLASIDKSSEISSVMNCISPFPNPGVSQINLVTKDFQPDKKSDPKIVLEEVNVKPRNYKNFPVSSVNTSAVTSSQTSVEPINNSEIGKTDILTKVLQSIGMTNFSMPKASTVNNVVPLQINKVGTVESTKISISNDSTDSSKESNTIQTAKNWNILSSFSSNSVDDSHKIGEKWLNKQTNHSNKESMFEYVKNHIKDSQCNVIESSEFVSNENRNNEITDSSVIKTVESNIESLNNNKEEQSSLLGRNLAITQSFSVSSLHEPNSIGSDNRNEQCSKPQPQLNALDSLVSLNTDDLKRILESARNTNVSEDLTVDDSYPNNIAIQRNSLIDVQYVSNYDQAQNKKADVSVYSDYMYYDYQSPFLRIPTVRDYGHKSPFESVTNEGKDSNAYGSQLDKDISSKNNEEAASDSDEGVDNEFLPEGMDANIDSEKEEDNPLPEDHSNNEVQTPTTINKNKDEKEKSSSTEEPNKELPQYKSRWERIMERKAIEKNKDEDLLLSYFHLSRSRRSNIPYKAGDPPKITSDLEQKSKLQKNNSFSSVKMSAIKKDSKLPVLPSDNFTLNINAQKSTKGQKSFSADQIKETAVKKEASKLKKTRWDSIHRKYSTAKVSTDKSSSSHKKSNEDQPTNKSKLNKISPIKKKGKFKQLSLSDDSSSNLFAPDKVIKVSDEKKLDDSFGKKENDKKKIYGRVTNRGSFLTQSPLCEKPKVKTIQNKKNLSKSRDKSAFSDEIHSRIITPNIELSTEPSTLLKYTYNYFDDPNYKDDAYSYNGYPKKRLSISNSSDMSISPIADFSSPPVDIATSVGNSSSNNVLPFIQSGKSIPDPRLKSQHPLLPNISSNVISSFASTHTNIIPRRETTPVFQSSLVSNSKFNFDSLSSISNERLSSVPQSPVHNVNNRPKHRPNRCVCLPPRHMKDSVGHTVFDTMNVLLLILEWNVDWLFQQRKNSSPPPISKCVNKVINTYENFESYYNTYFPLLLLETWQRIYVSWNHLHTAPPYICEIKAYSVEQSSIKVECQTIFNPADTDRGLFPEEGNIMMVKFGTKSKGGIKTLGYITEVKVRAFNPSTDSQSKCYQSSKRSPSDHLQLLQMSFIGAYTSEDFDIKLPIRVHVLCNVKINLKQNDALLKAKDSPLGKNILNPMEDELRVVELASRDSIDEEKIAFCVKEIVKGILSPHPIPIVTIVKSYPSSDRLMILPPLIKRMKDSYGTKVLLCARTTKCLIDIGLYLDENHVKFVITGKRADVPLKLKRYLVEDLAINRALSDQLSEGSGQEDSICKENLKQESVAKAKKFVFNECDVILSLIKNCHDDCLGQAFADGDSISQLCCIIDEANLCTEPELLIPVLFGISKLILIGNPDVTAKVCSKTASSYGYGKSLFHRAYELDLISE